MASDPRLIALYDDDNPDGPDHDHARALAEELGARTIVDLGCGTGQLAVTLARPGRTVIGVDPDVTAIEYARRRAGGEGVIWTSGDSTVMGDLAADLIVLTGNSVQHIGEADWPRTLRDIARTLREGGVLLFDSRNPVDRAWDRWTATPKATRSTQIGDLTEWVELDHEDPDGTVHLDFHSVFDATGEHLTVRQPLVFRSAGRLTKDLTDAGLSVRATFGDWTGGPLLPSSPRIVVEAVR
ncbi:class I SAM-dependent methyltransferase [Nakamurella sp.]|uniref:class I SAM-dependent methyltransferase n=1 Tax=Nakamurella sp. TaxID=1869182 RepID=UPI0037844B6E